MSHVNKLNILHVFKVIKIQNEGADPKFFTLKHPKTILASLLFDRCVGVFDGRKLIAYSIFSNATDEDLLNLNDKCEKVGKFSGTVVTASYRGRGLQKLFLNSHVEYARNNGYTQIMAYVHRENKASIASVEKSGLSYLKKLFIESKNDHRNIYLMNL